MMRATATLPLVLVLLAGCDSLPTAGPTARVEPPARLSMQTVTDPLSGRASIELGVTASSGRSVQALHLVLRSEGGSLDPASIGRTDDAVVVAHAPRTTELSLLAVRPAGLGPATVVIEMDRAATPGSVRAEEILVVLDDGSRVSLDGLGSSAPIRRAPLLSRALAPGSISASLTAPAAADDAAGIVGDCSPNGMLDVNDILAVARIAVGLAGAPASGSTFDACDADQSLSIDVSDVRIIALLVVGQPASGAALRRNQPAGWTVLTDYGFDGLPPTHVDGSIRTGTFWGTGLNAVDWGIPGGGMARSLDLTAPASPGYVLEEIYPPHLSGSGPDKVTRSLPSAGRVYISWIVKWEAGFHHNQTSEKLLYFNYDGRGGAFLFQFQYGVEMITGIREAGGYESLRANQRPANVFGHGFAPPENGRWMEYELLFDRSAGTVRWWKDGVLQGAHSGVSFGALRQVDLTATWGGGGDKIGTHSRFTDHLTIAVSN